MAGLRPDFEHCAIFISFGRVASFRLGKPSSTAGRQQGSTIVAGNRSRVITGTLAVAHGG